MKLKLNWIILLAIALVATAAGFFNYTIIDDAVVNASVFNLSPQLSDIRQWHKWNKPLFEKRNKNIKIKIINPALFTIQEEDRASVEQIAIRPLGDTVSLVQWTIQETGFRWLRDKLGGKDGVEKQLAGLKAFAENPDAIFGFPIRIVKVTDRVLCTTQKVVTKDNVLAQVPKMLNDLKAFLASNSIPVHQDYYYLSYFPQGHSVELTVAFPVSKEVHGGDGFKFLKFPANGRLLVGTYQGNYTGLPRIYLAMDKYMTDHNLTKVAQVLEAYPFKTDPKKAPVVRIIYPIY